MFGLEILRVELYCGPRLGFCWNPAPAKFKAVRHSGQRGRQICQRLTLFQGCGGRFCGSGQSRRFVECVKRCFSNRVRGFAHFAKPDPSVLSSVVLAKTVRCA
jgi:hypothetical protein